MNYLFVASFIDLDYTVFIQLILFLLFLVTSRYLAFNPLLRLLESRKEQGTLAARKAAQASSQAEAMEESRAQALWQLNKEILHEQKNMLNILQNQEQELENLAKKEEGIKDSQWSRTIDEKMQTFGPLINEQATAMASIITQKLGSK